MGKCLKNHIAVLLCLSVLFSLCACGGHSDKLPARLRNARELTTPVIDGIQYEVYTEIDISADADGNSPWDGCFDRGKLFGYHDGCLYSYFYEIEGLDRKSWFLCQMDDVNGAQNETNAEIWKAEGTTEIPAWIEEARELWMGDNYSGLPEGCTIIDEIPYEESAEE